MAEQERKAVDLKPPSKMNKSQEIEYWKREVNALHGIIHETQAANQSEVKLLKARLGELERARELGDMKGNELPPTLNRKRLSGAVELAIAYLESFDLSDHLTDLPYIQSLFDGEIAEMRVLRNQVLSL